MNSKRGRHQPGCIAAHDCINKLAAIVGHCDLVLELTKSGSEIEKRIQKIRGIAQQGIAEMKQHQQDVSAQTQKPDQQKAG
jgi:hypothetical protein